MDVVGKDRHGVDVEREPLSCAPSRFAWRLYLVDQERALALQECCCEKPASSGNEGSAVIGHPPRLALRDAANTIVKSYFLDKARIFERTLVKFSPPDTKIFLEKFLDIL
jgi:hypothetical protein